MDTFFYDFCVSSEKHGINDLEGRVEVTVVSGGQPARVNCLPEHADPGWAAECELGDIEIITGSTRGDNGHFIWNHAPMPDGPLGDALVELIRDSIDMADVGAAAMENATSASEDYADWRRDQKRDDFFEQAMKVAGR
jgi:hypothetical protein